MLLLRRPTCEQVSWELQAMLQELTEAKAATAAAAAMAFASNAGRAAISGALSSSAAGGGAESTGLDLNSSALGRCGRWC